MSKVICEHIIPIVLIDTREQHFWDFTSYGFKQQFGTLAHGDYSLFLPNLMEYFTIERKSLPDFVACCGTCRVRFTNELKAMRGYPHKMVIIEASMDDIVQHRYESAMNPNSIVGMIAKWSCVYQIPIILAGSHQYAQDLASRVMLSMVEKCVRTANYIWSEKSPDEQKTPEVDPDVNIENKKENGVSMGLITHIATLGKT